MVLHFPKKKEERLLSRKLFERTTQTCPNPVGCKRLWNNNRQQPSRHKHFSFVRTGRQDGAMIDDEVDQPDLCWCWFDDCCCSNINSWKTCQRLNQAYLLDLRTVFQTQCINALWYTFTVIVNFLGINCNWSVWTVECMSKVHYFY